MTPRIWRILAVAGGALLLLGLWGVHAGGVSAGRLEARLQQAAEAALAGREHGWAAVSLNGQTATVTGQAPSDAARLDALAAVEAAEWAGGSFAGGVTRVIDDTTPTAIDSDFGLRARALNGRLVMTGEVATDTTRDALTRYAERLFPAGADVSLQIEADTSADPASEEAARRLLAELARLDRGSIAVRSNRGVLHGVASNGQTASSTVRGATDLPDPVIGAAYIENGGGAALSVIPDAQACGVLFHAALREGDVQFDPALETLVDRSRGLLTSLGAMLETCPDTRLTVTVAREGGIPLDPQRLAEARAEAVREALVSGGADGSRIGTEVAEPGGAIVRFETTQLEGE
ncbi:hypothetical protein [Hyphobacterium marinum]|uniref:BON domain-containing protein n=1 Tax=Hyphobacterium marinum TaxID=3116574 RepID=A0ABU7LZW1_9PROT|nr:hypothetical protein [Hyphobacterium sp. Y6023]MEE2567101.1 hypothetical protein [Hyphobacterium sp. Y6023]